MLNKEGFNAWAHEYDRSTARSDAGKVTFIQSLLPLLREGGTIYITHQPCGICAKMIVNAGIKRIVVREGYPDDLALEILEEAGLAVEKMSKEAACAGESAPQAQPNDREHQKTMQE